MSVSLDFDLKCLRGSKQGDRFCPDVNETIDVLLGSSPLVESGGLIFHYWDMSTSLLASSCVIALFRLRFLVMSIEKLLSSRGTYPGVNRRQT